MKIIPFIKYSKIWLTFSGLVTILSIIVLVVWGLKWSIDFTGGSLMELDFSANRPEVTELKTLLEKNDAGNALIQNTGENGVIVRTALVTEEAHAKVLEAIIAEFESEDNKIVEKRFEMIGPSVSSQLRQRSLWAIIFVCFGIIGYVAYAFRAVSRPVASWKYGAMAIAAVVHDVLLVIGIFAVLGHYKGTEIDVAFVVAMLTVLGYSINDAIVVFDRIRERLLRRTGESFDEIVNLGLNQTLMRSINTTLTTLLPLFALFFFGGTTIHNFALALLIGVASGAYSSIFIASPLLVYIEKWQRRA